LPAIHTQNIKSKNTVNIDTSSPTEFPTIGKPKTENTASQNKWCSPKSTVSFAQMAKAWSVKDDEDRLQKKQEEQQKLKEECQRPVYVRRQNTDNHTHTHTHTSYVTYNYPIGTTETHSDLDEEEAQQQPKSAVSNPLGIRREDFEFY
jgi:hypothetical protein